MRYRLVLACGYVHEGDDERELEAVLLGTGRPLDDVEAVGWTWVAGLYVRVDQVVAVETVRRSHDTT